MSDKITIKNATNNPVYVYDWDMSVKPAVPVSPLSNGNPLAAGDSLQLTMKPVADPSQKVSRRIYIAAAPLTQSLGGGGWNGPAAPDSFNPQYDGEIMFSFAEYNYESANNRYTFDLSYIDTFSYPLTATFAGGDQSGYEAGFEYGFTKLSTVKSALIANSGTWPWGNLNWPTTDPKNPGNADWPTNIHRVIGPNKNWTSDTFGMTLYAPESYQTFVKTLPFNGTQLFGSGENFTVWKDSETEPASTGYVKALRSAATPDKKGKYGFFTYCKDNTQGEFTWLPLDAVCTLKIYPFNT